MTTPKKPTETGSHPGESEAMGEILASFQLVDKDTDWIDNAKCHMNDGIAWFPEIGESHLVGAAKKFCSNCPVRKRCLNFALDNGIMYGVWGGKSSAERRRLLHSRKYKDRMGL
jgi:WhiB family redox-sensing transcriptional regulator